MRTSGHKTTSMEARYNIVDHADIKQAAQKMEAFHNTVRPNLRRAK
jgi:hypothetical protein